MPLKKTAVSKRKAGAENDDPCQKRGEPTPRFGTNRCFDEKKYGLVKASSLPFGYPNTQVSPFVFTCSPMLVQIIGSRRDIGIYIFSWLEASTMARCQCLSKSFYQARENREGFVEAAAKITPKLRGYRYADVVGVQISRGICVTQALSVLEALIVPLLYLVGGYNPRRLQTQRTVKRFLPWLNNYKLLAPLITPRRELGACLVENQLYAVGGVYGLNALSSVERYNPVKNIWQECGRMKYARRACAVTALNGKVYAAGGFSRAKSMSEVERFDATRNKWEAVASMNSERSGCCAAATQGFVYVLGGGNNSKKNDNTWAFSSVEKYNVAENKWEYVAEMKHSRRGAMAASIGSKIYVRGGKNNRNEDVSEIECYDPKSNNWMVVEHIEPPPHCDVFERRLLMEFERADGVEMIDGIAASGCLALTQNFIGGKHAC